MARPAGLEPAAIRLEGGCSIQLSYGRLKGQTWLEKMVGVEGFEPPTLWSQTRCATKLRYTPTKLGDCRVSGGANNTDAPHGRQRLFQKKLNFF